MTFQKIPFSDPDLRRPAAGLEFWIYQNEVTVPQANSPADQETQRYDRWEWKAFENATPGSYNWALFDESVNTAISRGQTFSFAIMAMCGGCGDFAESVNGATTTSIPRYVVQQGGAWNYGGTWTPNWNSPVYKNNLRNFHNALAAHINSTSYNGVPYSRVIKYIDLRGVGEYDEWHFYPMLDQAEAQGYKPTIASYKEIIDIFTTAYANFRLTAMSDGFDQGGWSNTPAEIIHYLITRSTNVGPVGWRRDNWGHNRPDWYQNKFETNPAVWNGVQLRELIMNRWRTAPVVGEPFQGESSVNGQASPYEIMASQASFYHLSLLGNGNMEADGNNARDNNLRLAHKTMGYRITLNGGTRPSTITKGTLFNISLTWANEGVAPTYDAWRVVFELRNTANGAVVWTGNSTFAMKNFLPGTATHNDAFTVPASVADGTYNLYMYVRDSAGYMFNMPIFISSPAAETGNVYRIGSNVVVSSSAGGNQVPVANAGADQVITLPTATTTLNGSGTDADGTIASYAWTKVSGPAGGAIQSANTAATGITGLTAGTYVYRLTVTDNAGSVDQDDITITVNAAPAPPPAPNVAPVANAGADRSITLPTNTVTLNGGGTDTDGTIASFSWAKVSGPAGGNIQTPAAASTSLTGLNAGTYVYRLTVTDNDGATHTDDVQVVVNNSTAPSPSNQAPVANSGADRVITLPTNSLTLSGSGTDADGSIATYAWTKVSGPTGGNVQSPNAASSQITAMVAGTYVFRLTVTDNAGALDTDDVQVVVNNAPAPVGNQAPIANAGTNLAITLPTNTANLAGSGTDPDGTISTYSWTKVSGPAGGTIGTPTQTNTAVSGLTQGTYVFRLTVTDNIGANATDDIQVVVNAAPVAPNQTPVANAGRDLSITLPVNSAALAGSGTDPDGTIASYSWRKVSGPNGGNLSSATIANPTVTGLGRGVYEFELTVTDNRGARATDRVIITVIRINQKPVLRTTDTLTLTMPVQNTELSAVDSYDPDGTISSYNWTYRSGPKTPRILTPSGSRTIVTDLVEGTFLFNVEATDNDGDKSNKAVVVIVKPNTGRRIVPDVSVYPNPATSAVNVQVRADLNGRTTMTFYDMNGRPVMTDVFNKAATRATRQVNINSLPRGTYAILIQVDQAEPVVEKLVKY